VLECAGIGFRARVSDETRKELPPDGESCILRTHLHFREGGADLYGFSTDTEREIFLATIGVSGVGPKSAMAMLSVLAVPGVLAAPEAQASEALAALGFPRTAAQLAVAAVRREKGADLPADLLIRESLRRLSGGR